MEQKIDLDSWNSNIDIVDQLNYFKEKNERCNKELEEKRKEKEKRENGKLGLKSLNEYLFIPEELTIGIAYYPEETEKKEEIVEYFSFSEMSLYDIFNYLIIKKQNDIDLLLNYICGEKYKKLENLLPIEQKIELLEEIENLNNINELFKGDGAEVKEEIKEEDNTLANCIKMLGGTIIYFCEEWGKLPGDVLKNLTYRQFKWYLDIIIERQEKLEEKLESEKNKSANEDARAKMLKEKGMIDNKFNSMTGDDAIKSAVGIIKDERGIVEGRIADESKGEHKASSEYNPFFDVGEMKKQGYKVIEDYEGAVVMRKLERY